MELTTHYIMSQVFVVLSYILLVSTYFMKNKNKILIFNFLSLICIGLEFFLLSAYTGVSMVIVAMIRNIMFSKLNKNNRYIFLIIIYVLLIISSIITYDGILCLLPVLTTFIYTYSIWQEDNKNYRILGIPMGILGILYNVYISSLFGGLCDLTLTISAVIGLIKSKTKSVQ